MAGTHIDCCISRCAQSAIIPNVNKSADAQPDYCMMTHAIETIVDMITMVETFDNECVGLAFAAPEFGPRSLYANLGGYGMVNASFFAMIWTPTG